ncbi:hypothetical protein ACEZ3G_11130 [Maribacter algicola]|uniref:Uncharacterized protein n=1 Tax=Meishania litoralis TaxID=3434685 RepID=A0ACC7LR34_9FLAO
MKNSIAIIGLLFCVHVAFVNAQYVVKNQTELEQLQQLPLEKIYVHYNTNLLFPGEYVYYSVYCINAQTNRLSNISRMAYIELVDSDLTTRITQKVRLEAGRAQGDFFIPVSIPSGNYKLIAYTQWMKNAGQDQLFQDDITIINPYRSDQEAITSGKEDLQEGQDLEIGQKGPETVNKGKKDDGTLVLITDNQKYGQRKKVSLTPRNFKGPLGYGNYSISVRRIDEFDKNGRLDAYDFSNTFLSAAKSITKAVNDSIALPEQRGELFYGNVRTREGGLPVAGKTVVISIPGTDFQLRSAITDDDGNFYTYIRKEYDIDTMVAQLIDNSPENYVVQFLDKPGIEYKGLNFGNFSISKEMSDAIVSRSVYNQIENAYYGVKPDSILAIDEKDPFDGGVPVVVNLDEFTRFNTLRETLVEVVPNVWVTKLDNGEYTFWVKEDLEPYDEQYASDPPLVLVDGVFVPDHGKLLDYNARTIKRLNILRDPLMMGSNKYHGMVVIETNDGDYLERTEDANMARKELKLPAAKKNYYQQRYGAEGDKNFERVPDFRYQLFWEPNLVIQNDVVSYEFYTSDVPGEYEIVLEGFTTYGKPISVRETIMVE